MSDFVEHITEILLKSGWTREGGLLLSPDGGSFFRVTGPDQDGTYSMKYGRKRGRPRGEPAK